MSKTTRSSALAETALVTIILGLVIAVDRLTVTITTKHDLRRFYFTDSVVNTWNSVVASLLTIF